MSQLRIEELENALEALLECFDTEGQGRPWIEVEVDKPQGFNDSNYVIETEIVNGQVNQTTADAIDHAVEVLYFEELGAEGSNE